MNPKPTRAHLEYVMRQPKGTHLIFGYCAVQGVKALRKMYGRHGFWFYSDIHDGMPWVEIDGHARVLHIAELATETQRVDHAKAMNPYGDQSRAWVGVSFHPAEVSFPLPPAGGPKLRDRQVPKVGVTVQLTVVELQQLDAARLPGESRGAAMRRLVLGPDARLNSPASTPPERV